MNRKRTHRANHTNSMFEALESRQMMSAGDLDPTFGAGGKIIAPDTIGYEVSDAAVQADGKLVVVGSLNGNFAVTRLNANGTLDRSFGGGGFVRTDFGGSGGDFANAVTVQPDGKIIVVGSRGKLGARSDTVFAIARYKPNGAPDSTFSGDGKQTIDLGKHCGANDVAVQPDGKIVIAGGADIGTVNINDNFAVARLLPNGSLDKTFGNLVNAGLSAARSGKTTIGFGADVQGERATMVAFAPGGKIVIGGFGGNGSARNSLNLAVTRLNSDGTFDTGFGDGISGKGKFNNLDLFANYRDMHVGADGSVTIVGGIHGNFLTVRLTSAGRLDRAFGGTGHIETDLSANDEAKHVTVNREGILVAGGSSGKFGMLRYRLNGQLDPTFGQGGKVITAMAPNDAILTSAQASDGKLTAYGRSGSAARYFSAVPKVNVFSLDPVGAEGNGNPASLVFTRDIRASFATRVFFDLGGSATIDADYTGLSTTALGSKDASSRVGFVDIPASETTATVPINIVDDKALEPVETVRAMIRTNAAYTLGNRTTQSIDIADNDIARVNFQVTPTPFAFAYEPDLGLPFGVRPNGQKFGWDVDNRANARDRGLASAPGMSMIYSTFNHMQKPGGGSKWEIVVPNGMYEVKLAAGDPNQVDSVYKMNLEGQLALSGTPGGATHWFERTMRVAVNDDRLTLSNATGAANNKIAFIEIRSAAPGAKAGPVTDNLPVNLPSAKPAVSRLAKVDAIFSQIEI